MDLTKGQQLGLRRLYRWLDYTLNTDMEDFAIEVFLPWFIKSDYEVFTDDNLLEMNIRDLATEYFLFTFKDYSVTQAELFEALHRNQPAFETIAYAIASYTLYSMKLVDALVKKVSPDPTDPNFELFLGVLINTNPNSSHESDD